MLNLKLSIEKKGLGSNMNLYSALWFIKHFCHAQKVCQVPETGIQLISSEPIACSV